MRLLSVVPRRGLVVAGIESPALARDPARGPLPGRDVRPRGAGADWRAVDVRTGAEGIAVPARAPGPGRGRVRAGAARASTTCATPWPPWRRPPRRGSSPEAARAALAAFRGVKRRLEVRGVAGGVTVYDDFAHHPTAVAATLAALRAARARAGASWPCSSRAPTPRARASSRTGFARAFAGADRVIVAAAHLPGKVPEAQRLSEAELVAGIGRSGTDASFVPTVDEIVRDAGRGGCGRATGSSSSRTGASAASTTSCSRPSKPPLAPDASPVGQTLWNRRGVRAITPPHSSHRCRRAALRHERLPARTGVGGTCHF